MFFTKISILTTYGKLISKNNKNYAYPSQQVLLKLLRQHYHISIQLRALNYHLADLRKQGYIKTIRRSHRTPQGYINQLTSAVCLTLKGCRLLYKFGSTWALGHLNKLRYKFGYRPRPKPQPEPEPAATIKITGDPYKDTMTDPEYLKKYPKMRRFVERKYGKQKPPDLDVSQPGTPEDPEQK